jgi:hypothetical protein
MEFNEIIYTLANIKASFNADTDHVNGISVMANPALVLYRTGVFHVGVQLFV